MIYSDLYDLYQVNIVAEGCSSVVCKTKAIGTFFDAQAKNITSVL